MSLISTTGGIIHDVARRLGTVSTNTGFSDKCLEWINDGILDMTDINPQFAPWNQSSAVLSLSEGTSKYKLSSIDADLSEIKTIAISAQNRSPRYFPPDQFNAQRPKKNVNGVPTMVTMWGDDIIFDPVPDGNYGAQIEFLRDAAAVSAASAVPPVPRRYLRHLSQYCYMRGLYDREDISNAQVAETVYERAKKKVRMRLARRMRQQKRMVGVREMQQNNRGYNDEVTNMFFND
jgi:hypothetical protein